jgi:hypothetical protein
MISEIITNGVLMANNSNALRVIANGDKSVTIQPGLCVINGTIKKFTEAKTMQLPVSADDNYRGIAICALFDLSVRDIKFYYYTYSAESATDLIPLNSMARTDTKYAIQLANIYIAPGYTRIVQSNITDTRLDTERCGAVSSISQFDTTNLYNQIQSDLASFKSTEQAEFQEWFENLQTVLDSNTAAHLQNEIDGLNSSKANKSDITNISITGTTNNTGSNILAGTLFYLNGTLCKTLVDVANGATFTDGTNYAQTNLKRGKIKINKSGIVTSSTDYAQLDTITIPANCYFSIIGNIVYANSEPTGVYFSTSPNSPNANWSRSPVGASYVSICGYTDVTATFVLMGKWANTEQTEYSIKGWYEYADPS